MSGTEVVGSIAIGLLTFILVDWLRPYVRKRSEEEGKIDALAANLETVKENTAQLTALTKKIEADVSDRVWDRQARWNLRRDTYVRVIENLSALVNVKSQIAFKNKHGEPLPDNLREQDTQLFGDMWSIFGICKVVLSSDANNAIQEFAQALPAAQSSPAPQRTGRRADRCSAIQIDRDSQTGSLL